MKKNILVILSILIIITLVGCQDKVSNSEIKSEQKRMVEYTLENYEDVRKIEFINFEQNFSTGFWHADAKINDNIYVSYTVANLSKKGKIWIGFYVADSQGRELKKRSKKREREIENINIIYKES